MSIILTFAVSIWKGDNFEIALKNACFCGLKIGGISWASSIISAQIGRTGIENSLRTVSDFVVIEDENSSLKKELQLTKIESKKMLELNQELLNKEKEILELKLSINLISIEVQNKDYIIDELKKENSKLNISLIELQNKLIEVSNMSVFNKIKFKYDKND